MLQQLQHTLSVSMRPGQTPRSPRKGSLVSSTHAKEPRTGLIVPFERAVKLPARFQLPIEESSGEQGTAATRAEAKAAGGLEQGSAIRLRLLGVGPRLYPLVGGLVKVSVYAVGFYAEETQGVAKLQALKPKLAKGGRHPPPEYYETLLSPEPWPRALYLHFARNVATYRIVEAFKPYPKLAGRILEQFKDTFDQYFGTEGIKTGDVIAFIWVKDGLLNEINGEVVNFVPEPELAREVFRVYLGDPPVSQEAKERLASEVPALLQAHAAAAAAGKQPAAQAQAGGK